jgi:hypothetical protein
MNSSSPSDLLGPKLREIAKELLDNDFSRSEAMKLFQKAFLVTLLEQEGGNLCRAADRGKFHRNDWYWLLDRAVIASVKNRCRLMKRNKMAQLELRGLKYQTPKVAEIRRAAAFA